MSNQIASCDFILGHRTYKGYRVNGSYYMSLKQIGSILNKMDNKSFSSFINSQRFKKENGGPIELIEGPANNKTFTPSLVPVKAVTRWILYWASKGDKTAYELSYDLMQQSLEVRIENNIAPITAEKVAEIQNDNPLWKLIREVARSEHFIFCDAVERKGHTPGLTHDYITKLCTGLTAQEARKLKPCVEGDETVGLNHQDDPRKLDLIRRVKYRYSILENVGSMEEQVRMAYEIETAQQQS